MKDIENKILFIGLFLWVIGDLVTTAIGWNLGLKESWFMQGKTFFQLTMLKIGVVGIALIAIDNIEKINKNYLKIPIYFMFIFIGSIAVVGNTIAIIGAI